MKKQLALILALFAFSPLPASAALSANAKKAFKNWHLCSTNPDLPPGYIGMGSRRFVGTTITWKVDTAGTMNGYVRPAMAALQAQLAGAVTLTEVPFTSPALYSIHAGSTIHDAYLNYDMPVTHGCVTLSTLDADRMTVLSIETVCADPNAVDQKLAMHEAWWHAFLTIACHTSSGCGAGDPADGAPTYQCVPGQTELVRWFYTVPVGSTP